MADAVEEVSTSVDPVSREQPSVSVSVADEENKPGPVSEQEQVTIADSTITASKGSEPPSATSTTSPAVGPGDEAAATPNTKHSTVSNCVFCRIIGKELPSEIVYEDADFVCFVDRSPASRHHYLVAPRQHIRDAKSLSLEQLPLIDKMAEVGKKVLTERGGSLDDVRLGFHWPPFLMVRHLHMHVISPASQMGWLNRNVVFRKDSFAFTSPAATIDYLKKFL